MRISFMFWAMERVGKGGGVGGEVWGRRGSMGGAVVGGYEL